MKRLCFGRCLNVKPSNNDPSADLLRRRHLSRGVAFRALFAAHADVKVHGGEANKFRARAARPFQDHGEPFLNGASLNGASRKRDNESHFQSF
jgi:hypothetical protein